MATPLAETLRPKDFTDFVGQEHLVGKNRIIKKLLQNGSYFPSMILWGPPGSGKTTLARIIANKLKRPFFEFSAVNTSMKDIEKIVNQSKTSSPRSLFTTHSFAKPPIIFIDEIHRLNKSQQSRLLPSVENGEILLIGATTENPSFEVIGPLLSRCRVLILKQLTQEQLKKIISKAQKVTGKTLEKDAQEFLLEASNGDARVAINVLEIASQLTKQKTLVVEDIEQSLQRRQLNFDLRGEEYYNVISAFIKSMRASQPDAALYYLARMVQAGQDPLYIARRMVIFASEDIGMADPNALVVANEVFRACDTIGYPECAINLAHGVIYLSQAPKDRSAYNALRAAQQDAEKHGNLPVPLKIRNPVTKFMRNIGYGKGYKKYTKEDLLPDQLQGKKYYRPSTLKK